MPRLLISTVIRKKMLSLIKKIQKKRVIRNIRRHFLALGYDLSNLTDEELEKSIVDLGKQFKNIGVSVKEALDVFKKLANIVPSYNKTFHTDNDANEKLVKDLKDEIK